MELPTQKNLAYYALAVLLSTVTGLSGYIVQLQGKCDAKDAMCQVEKAQLQAEIKDALKKQSTYFERQDSINRANAVLLEKTRRRK